jgi:hypothetical protein
MRIRAAGARGGDTRLVGDCCRSAQATQSASQPGAVRVRERQVASGLVGPEPFPTELGSALFKWADRLALFFYSLLFQINSEAPISKIQITFFLNSKNLS